MPVINGNSLKRKAELLEPSEHEPDLSQVSLQDLLLSFNIEINKRLDKIEQRLDTITETCEVLEKKIKQNIIIFKNRDIIKENTRITSNPSTLDSDNSCLSGCSSTSLADPNISFTILNNESQYPNGSWLGNEKIPELRIRCPVTPTELLYINTSCNTSEKMALTLLDHLFDSETQATSNISGTGKHKKKRLNPLFIHGIHCHLISQFGISNDHWNKIKQSIDSKCRTAFRKKIKGFTSHDKMISNATEFCNKCIGIPLSTTNSEPEVNNITTIISEISSRADFKFVITNTSEPLSENEVDMNLTEVQCIVTTHEEFDQIKETHHVQVLSDGRILAIPVAPLQQNND